MFSKAATLLPDTVPTIAPAVVLVPVTITEPHMVRFFTVHVPRDQKIELPLLSVMLCPFPSNVPVKFVGLFDP